MLEKLILSLILFIGFWGSAKANELIIVPQGDGDKEILEKVCVERGFIKEKISVLDNVLYAREAPYERYFFINYKTVKSGDKPALQVSIINIRTGDLLYCGTIIRNKPDKASAIRSFEQIMPEIERLSMIPDNKGDCPEMRILFRYAFPSEQKSDDLIRQLTERFLKIPNFFVLMDRDHLNGLLAIQDQFNSGENYKNKRASYVNGKMCPADVICKIAVENGNRLHVWLVTSDDGQLRKEGILLYGKNYLDDIVRFLLENITREYKFPNRIKTVGKGVG